MTPGFEGAKVGWIDRLLTIHHGGRSLPLMSAAASNRMRWRLSDASVYKALWFHDAGMFSTCQSWIGDNQFIIYQPHCPELPWQEYEDEGAAVKVEAATRQLFKRANLIILPNEGCVSIYQDLIDLKKLAFLPSACLKAAPHAKIPLDPRFTYFLYIGRRNHIKGFDILLTGFKRAFAERSDIRLILCGRGEAVTHQAIIDLGVSERIHEWIASCDCVVNVNRQSYFDLSMMETLSIGGPIALTATNGHAGLVGKSKGIIEINPDNGSLSDFFKRFRPSRPEIKHMRCQNIKLYNDFFSTNQYHKRLSIFLDNTLQSIKAKTGA